LVKIVKAPAKKKTENFIDICENCWKLKTIGFLLQMHNRRCNLHTYVEIMETKFEHHYLKEVNIWQRSAEHQS